MVAPLAARDVHLSLDLNCLINLGTKILGDMKFCLITTKLQTRVRPMSIYIIIIITHMTPIGLPQGSPRRWIPRFLHPAASQFIKSSVHIVGYQWSLVRYVVSIAEPSHLTAIGCLAMCPIYYCFR
jgi:hypothetical protein